jgi:hypothetical protein
MPQSLAATTLMLIDAALRTWYRDGGAPLQRTVDSLIEGVACMPSAGTLADAT